MKIAILTQPLHTNYGGLLQAYALQEVLRRTGHDVLTVDRRNVYSPWQLPLRIAKRALYSNLIKRRGIALIPKKIPAEVSQHMDRFIRENIKTTILIKNKKEIRALLKHEIESFVVGSDQVWRPCYSPGIETFFLDFLEHQPEVRKVAYAASFGVDDWEFSPKQTKNCARLAKKFDAISVRENSGICLCEKYLGVKAQCVLDPTLLLSRLDYEKLINKEGGRPEKSHLMTYILDKNIEKQEIIQKMAQVKELSIFDPMPQKDYLKDANANLEECVFSSVETWLSGFRDAEFVITDSFHGTVFSLIFQKPFLAFGNKARGLGRFTSLLRQFDLEDRLILEGVQWEDIAKLNQKSIDWKRITAIRENLIEKSYLFLQDAGLISAKK